MKFNELPKRLRAAIIDHEVKCEVANEEHLDDDISFEEYERRANASREILAQAIANAVAEMPVERGWIGVAPAIVHDRIESVSLTRQPIHPVAAAAAEGVALVTD